MKVVWFFAVVAPSEYAMLTYPTRFSPDVCLNTHDQKVTVEIPTFRFRLVLIYSYYYTFNIRHSYLILSYNTFPSIIHQQVSIIRGIYYITMLLIWMYVYVKLWLRWNNNVFFVVLMQYVHLKPREPLNTFS